MDSDNNQTIDTGEFRYFLEFISEKTGTPMPSTELIEQTMKELDKNDDGVLTLNEIAPYVLKLLKNQQCLMTLQSNI